MKKTITITTLILFALYGCTSKPTNKNADVTTILVPHDNDNKPIVILDEKATPEGTNINDVIVDSNPTKSKPDVTEILIEEKTEQDPSSDLLSQSSSHPSSNTPDTNLDPNKPNQLFICEDISPYINTVVGNGQCVDLLKECARVSLTQNWHQGQSVWGNKIPTGTAIATFQKGIYPNIQGYHAAIYISQDEQGIYVWDQWTGKPVHTRLITNTPGKLPGNTAQNYSVIKRY